MGDQTAEQTALWQFEPYGADQTDQAALWQDEPTAAEQQFWQLLQQRASRNGAEGDETEWDVGEDDEPDWNATLRGGNRSGGKQPTLYAQAYQGEDGKEAEDAQDIGFVPNPFGTKQSKGPRSLFNPFEPLTDTSDHANVAGESARSGRETLFDHPEIFYPPVSEPEDAGENWPYATYPQSDAVFTHHGYTYPEYVEPGNEDEDLTDAAAPPKSLYVEPDEAERAKRLLDKYFGGGRKR